MARKGSSLGVLLIGILIGALVGSGVAMLSAPQSGEKTRMVLRDKGMELRDKASATVQDTRSKATDMIGRVRSRTGDIAGQMSQQANQETEI